MEGFVMGDMADTESPSEMTPPPDLPASPAAFWDTPHNSDVMPKLPTTEAQPALQRLGPLPLPRGCFPLMGFLASVYDQVASFAQAALGEQEDEPKNL